MSQGSEDRLLNEYKRQQVKERVFRHIAGTKLNQVIAFLLAQYYKGSADKTPLSKEVLDLIKEESRSIIA
jgi:hypothetical protein